MPKGAAQYFFFLGGFVSQQKGVVSITTETSPETQGARDLRVMIARVPRGR
jgi:hypothetical protein